MVGGNRVGGEKKNFGKVQKHTGDINSLRGVMSQSVHSNSKHDSQPITGHSGPHPLSLSLQGKVYFPSNNFSTVVVSWIEKNPITTKQHHCLTYALGMIQGKGIRKQQ